VKPTIPDAKHSIMKPNLFLKSSLAAGLVLVLIGAIGFMSLTWLRDNAQQIVNDTLPGLALAGAANTDLGQAFNRTLLLLLAENPERRAQLTKEIEQFSDQTTAHLAQYKKQIYELEDQNNFYQLITARTNYIEIRARVMALADAGQHAEAVNACHAELLPAYTAYKEAGEVLFRFNRVQGELRGQNIMTTCRYTRLAVAFICIGIFVGGFFFGLR
jgi:hypothetical protein